MLKPMKNNPLKAMMSKDLTDDNYTTHYRKFQDRQAGVSLVFNPDDDRFYYNAYCLEMKLLKELSTVEFAMLEEALEFINEDFKTWDLESYEEKKSGCSTCVAK